MDNSAAANFKNKKIKYAFNWLSLFSNIIITTGVVALLVPGGMREDILIPFLVLGAVPSMIFSQFRLRIPAYLFSAFVLFFALGFPISMIIDNLNKIMSGDFVILAGSFLSFGGAALAVMSHIVYFKEDKAIKQYNKMQKERLKSPEAENDPEPAPEQETPAPEKKKRFAKSLAAALSVALAAILVSLAVSGIFGAIREAAKRAADERQEKILGEYANYPKVSAAENKSGIGIAVNKAFDSYTIDIQFSHPEMNQSKNNIEAVCGRIYVLDAETREDAGHRVMFTTKTTTIPGQGSAVTYNPSVSLTEKTGKIRFVLLCFNGISSEEAPEMETPPLFYIIRLNADDFEVLTDSPLKMNELFRE
jgi:hypothetical protein